VDIQNAISVYTSVYKGEPMNPDYFMSIFGYQRVNQSNLMNLKEEQMKITIQTDDLINDLSRIADLK
jgi:hypothetical protein